MLQLVVNRNLKTAEQFNVAEKIETAMMEKELQFEKFMNITMHHTSDMQWVGKVFLYKEGSYIMMEGCRSGLNVFLDNNYNACRKPIDSKLTLLETYNISGNYTEIQGVYRDSGCRKIENKKGRG